MTQRSERFAIHFAILFLTVLLVMFALFHIMRANDGRSVEGGTLNFAEAFRVNLFIIDLSLLLVAESLLVFLFVRYTAPALAFSTGVIIAVTAFRRPVLERETVTRLFAPFVRNAYAALHLRDALLLLVLNALLLAFMIAMMHHYHRLDAREERALKQAKSRPAPRNAPGPRPPQDERPRVPPPQV